MDPYREKNPLDAVNERLQSILEELERLKPLKASPIKDAIGYKIKNTKFLKMFGVAILFLLSLVFVVYFLWGVFVAPHPLMSCGFDPVRNDDKVVYYIDYDYDWEPNANRWGPFKSMKEAHDFAILNKCPAVPDLPPHLTGPPGPSGALRD